MHCSPLLKNAMLKQHLTATNITTGNYHSTAKICTNHIRSQDWLSPSLVEPCDKNCSSCCQYWDY